MKKTAYAAAIAIAALALAGCSQSSDSVMANYAEGIDSHVCVDLAGAALNVAKMRDNGLSREGLTKASMRHQPNLAESYRFNYVADHVFARGDAPDQAHRRFLRDCAARL